MPAGGSPLEHQLGRPGLYDEQVGQRHCQRRAYTAVCQLVLFQSYD